MFWEMSYTLYSAIPLLDFFPRKRKCVNNLYKSVPNPQDCICRRPDQQNASCSRNSVPCSDQTQPLLCAKTDEPPKHYALWKEQEATVYLVIFHLYEDQTQAKLIYSDQNRRVVACDVGWTDWKACNIWNIWKLRLSNKTHKFWVTD